MPLKDSLFVISYIVLTVLLFVYFIPFSKNDWVKHDDGHFGLWVKGEKNNDTGLIETYRRTSLAVGPAFLDITRTIGCFVIVILVIGTFLHFSDHSPKSQSSSRSWKEIILPRLQELSSFIAGCLQITMAVVFDKFYKEHYEVEVGYTNAHLASGWYILVVVASLTVCFSILLFWTRPEIGTESKSTTTPVPAPVKQHANSFKKKDDEGKTEKKTPTPIEQKKKTEGEKEETMQEVEVKKGWARSIIAPTQVILVMKRLKSGMKREETKDVEKTGLVTPSTSKKNKDIFTVQVDNKQEEESPPGLPHPIEISSRRYSTSSSSSKSSDDISVLENKTDKATEASPKEQRPPPLRKHFSQNEADLRANATAAAIVVTDEASVERADRLPRPPKPKRHATESDARLRLTAVGLPDENVDGNLNIYTIHPEPGAQPSVAPPSYNEVITNEGSFPREF